jgi:hypothetical protein
LQSFSRPHSFPYAKNTAKGGKRTGMQEAKEMASREEKERDGQIPVLLHTGFDISSLTGFPFSQHPSSS